MRPISLLPCVCALLLLRGLAAQQPPVDAQRSAQPEQRIPQQKPATLAALQGLVLDDTGRPVPGVEIRLAKAAATTSGDGIFRLLGVQPGTYNLILTPQDAASVRRLAVELHAGEVLSIEVHLPAATAATQSPLAQFPQETLGDNNYRELSRRPDADGAVVVPKEIPLPPAAANFQPQRDRWGIPMPDYHRYDEGETPYVLGHWYDPFDRNVLKADRPIFGKTFFSFTGDSITAADVRRLPVPSGQSTAQPLEQGFFGRGGQFFIAQTFRMTFDLFHGDTAAFRPVDWRIRITSAANINYLDARENQFVCPDVRCGTTRLDGHVSLQEAFGEVKLHDFGPNYDFVNLRAGIQQFVSDFRGFIFADEQPGVRLFGNLRSNRIQYNLAGFDLLEKNTNSGLNKFARRGREVAIGNVYIQDFFAKGYTTQFSYHFVRDNASTHYDDNGFLVRPAPIGTVQPHRIDAHYFGWTGDGHIGRTNVTHAFYEVRGNDQLNEIAGQRNEIDAQFAAVELSQDHDWLRFRTSFLFASGDNNPRDRVARGFSSIVNGVAFAGGEFSFFNREGIPLTRAGVALTAPDSFLPDLRSSKDEGQSNFVNPGLYLYNAGFDADLTPTVKLVGNVNFLQFARTQPLVFLLQQNAIPRTIGFDSGIGAIYRPLLSDNITIHAGATALVTSSGLRQIYTSQTLFSVFAIVKFQF
ncbi:MAG TPA: carboxypeptidase-like regulatory domain-containing protein [Acidobacteriaceae bacterium]|nr:carboxypeptidase-like regulatory domain-containing protein [Acidobacteriaceae bacterium]